MSGLGLKAVPMFKNLLPICSDRMQLQKDFALRFAMNHALRFGTALRRRGDLVQLDRATHLRSLV
jgi:hypothetical protein